MTPKEKAIELANKFYETCNCTIAGTSTIFRQIGVQAALIAIDEMINMCKLYHNYNIIVDTKIYTELSIEYWQEVKQEIEEL